MNLHIYFDLIDVLHIYQIHFEGSLALQMFKRQHGRNTESFAPLFSVIQ